MKIASVADVKARLSSYLKASATDPIVVTRNGKAVAVLLGVHDEEELEHVLSARSRKLSAILDAADRRIDKGAGLGHDEFWKKVESVKRSSEAKGNGKRRRTSIGSRKSRGRTASGD
jgi:prevent-host-death family protein